MLNEAQLIEIFKALSDPNRLQLYELLLKSDQTNSELIGQTGLSQNLLSHHLSVLNEAGLIDPQRSIGDARRRYYCPNLRTMLAMCRWWQRCSPATARPLPALKQRKRVLFLCRTNAERSLIAEALAHQIAAGAIIPESAGLMKAREELSPLALTVLAEHGVPTKMLKTKSASSFANKTFDYVVTVCDRVHEHKLPAFLSEAGYVHWSLRDPLQEAETEAEQLAITRELYDDIELRLSFFVQRLLQDEAQGR